MSSSSKKSSNKRSGKRLTANSVPDLRRVVNNSPDSVHPEPVSGQQLEKFRSTRLHHPQVSPRVTSPGGHTYFDGLSPTGKPLSSLNLTEPGLDSCRRRVYTMPSQSTYQRGTYASNPNMGMYRLRSFSVTTRGVINLGDLLCYRSGSDVSMTSECSSSGNELECPRDRSSSIASTPRTEIKHYNVLVMGDESVGKSSLIAQFMTSEYLTVKNAGEVEQDDGGKKEYSVSVLIGEEEAELICKEITDDQMNEENYSNADAIIVAYSVTDKRSFRTATRSLAAMREIAKRQPITAHPLGPGLVSKAVILVGNKSDLARKRIIPIEDGSAAAAKYEAKFIETSVAILHNVDELLVGVLSQIRLKARQSAAVSARHSHLRVRARSFVHRLLEKYDRKFRSCDNLYF